MTLIPSVEGPVILAWMGALMQVEGLSVALIGTRPGVHICTVSMAASFTPTGAPQETKLYLMDLRLYPISGAEP